MRVIPVLDIKNEVVVRGVGGRRKEYQPIASKLTASCRPMDVARAFRDRLGLAEIYLADLDAIAGETPAWSTYSEIQALGCRLWIDAGVQQVADALGLAGHGILDIVMGLETIAGPEVLGTACRQLGSDRIIFSLDLQDGVPLGRMKNWKGLDPQAIAAEAIGVGIRRLIILDLRRVGMGQGTGTEAICRKVANTYPGVEITAGGGIRDSEDLQRLASFGVTSVLVSSALHTLAISPKNWHHKDLSAQRREL
jgi:phosphoribosylformimino-5-aminoimidazole carboxamide ribotide isomerase